MTSEKTFLLAVVTYRSNEHYGHIRSALASYLAKREKDIAIIVENSGDCSAEEIGRGLPGVHMLFPSRNIGFSPAVNLAYQTALERTGSIDAVILLNPDLLVDGDRILRLVEYASRNASIGVCSALLRDSDGAIDQGSARRRWNRRA